MFGVIGLGHGSEHTHGGLGRGQMLGEIAEVLFEEIDPTGTARGNHRQYAAIFQPMQKFRALLHYGEIRAEIRIEYFVKT